MAHGRVQVPVEAGDHVERDLLGAGRGALADVGAAAEALVVVLRGHVDHAAVALGLALRQLAEVGDLGTDEQRRRPVGAGRHAGAAADAGGDVEGPVGLVLRHGYGVRVRGRAGVDRDVAAGLDDPVEGRAVDAEVLDDRERVGPPGLDDDLVAVLEGAHVQLAGRGDLGAVRLAVDHQATHAADALAAVGVERDGFLALGVQLLVEDVEHLEERHVGGDRVELVGLHGACGLRVRLAPDLEGQSHL